jgi:uncharacterized SAM-binding protein YcdF (DUF218 family)
MFVLQQFLKALILPPTLWLLMLLVVLFFWRRRWARKLLLLTLLLIVALHSGLVNYALRYPLESHYPPLLDPRAVSYDAIVVLTSSMIPPEGLIPFPTIDEHMFRRLDEAWRLYRIQPRPIILSGGHVNPFTPDKDENRIGRDYLILWGVAKEHVIGEGKSRDTFESAVEVQTLLRQRGWRRYLLVTSALHMPRSMLAFKAKAPEPIPAPGDYSLGKLRFTPLDFFPGEGAARNVYTTLHEYVGMANYYWRIHYGS